MNLIVSETIRVLPVFLADYPSLTRILKGRKLVVRMLDDYTGSLHAVIREEMIGWDILDGIFNGD